MGLAWVRGTTSIPADPTNAARARVRPIILRERITLREMFAKVTKGALSGNAGETAHQDWAVNGEYVDTSDGLKLDPEHRVTLSQMMEKLDGDPALDAAARVNTRENVRLTFDHKVEAVIQEIVDSNFELYKRITDDRGFGEVLKNFLFDQYLRRHRNAVELIKRGESKTLEFKSSLRWSLKENRLDSKGVTHAAMKTIAAFLNTEGGDLLIGVADDGSATLYIHRRKGLAALTLPDTISM